MTRRQIFKYPAVSRDRVAFVYAGDIWVAWKDRRKAKGKAMKLTSALGQELYPRFSPDGQWIAFSSRCSGSWDLYVVPVEGGVPQRLTFHPLEERMIDWLPDGSILFSRTTFPFFVRRLYRLKLKKIEENGCHRGWAADGEPQELPLRYGAYGHVSGSWQLAFQTVVRGFSGFRGYRGALAPEIYLVDLKKPNGEIVLGSDIRNLTVSPANDSHPMWEPEGKRLFFVSDRESDAKDRYNLWVIDDPTADEPQARQLTFNTDADVRAPSIGPKDIVWEQDGQLYLLPLSKTRQKKPKPQALKIEVSSDRFELMPQQRQVGDLIESYDISPDGTKAVFGARGQIFVIEGTNGPIRQLTRDSGVGNRYPTFSPDGERVAYFSDAARECGDHSSCKKREYHLVERNCDGSGDERLLHCFEDGFRFRIFWSPKGDRLAFADLKDDRLGFYDFDTGEFHEVDRLVRFIQNVRPRYTVSWSPCGNWLVYARRQRNGNQALFLYSVKDDRRHRLTRGFYDDRNPVFDPTGNYLFYLTRRSFTRLDSGFREGFVFGNSVRVAAVRLRTNVPRLSEAVEAGQLPAAVNGAVAIGHQDFESRVELLDIEAGNLRRLDAGKGSLFYLREAPEGGDEETSLRVFGLLSQKEDTVLERVGDYRLSADGSTLLVRAAGGFGLLPAQASQTLDASNRLPTDQLETEVDLPAEWQQIFLDAWRLARDEFFAPSQELGWEGRRDHYAPFAADAATRWDINEILDRMLRELRASHTSVSSEGEVEVLEGERKIGFFGADITLGQHGLRVDRVLDPGLWNIERRSPLESAGIASGSWIVAVNGTPIRSLPSFWSAFEGLEGQRVELSVLGAGAARPVRLLTLAEEASLRYFDWVEANRRFVEHRASEVGYIHIRNVFETGRRELLRQFQWQIDREALIIDLRFNGGGNQLRVIERFLRLIAQDSPTLLDLRYDDPEPTAILSHTGTKVLLINQWTRSYAEHLASLFKRLGLGEVMGTRTGGVGLGTSGSPPFVDFGEIIIANWPITDAAGNILIENEGVSPTRNVEQSLDRFAHPQDDLQLARALKKLLPVSTEAEW